MSITLGCIKNDINRIDSVGWTLEQTTSTDLTNQQFDNFMAACMDESSVPSPRIPEAAKRLDQEGF